MLLENRKTEIEEKFKEVMQDFGKAGAEIEKAIQQEESQLALVLQYLYSNMPYSDIANYPLAVFADYARHGVYLWEQGAFKEKIPENIFLQYVLYHRVNTEELEVCRSYFYERITDLVQPEDMKKSVLDLNYWCAKEVTYQSTDERTLGPRAVYQRGYGRCGEESVFMVHILRSVGIPARQVYVPRWSHCDDNHAWVEVWCDGEWYFLGACEPEEVLNRGWFTNAATRAMMIRSKWYETDSRVEKNVEREGLAASLNQLSRYAATKELRVMVKNEQGQAVCGAYVDFEVINYAAFFPIATVMTDKEGVVVLETGYGSLHLHIRKGNYYTQVVVDGEETQVIVTLSREMMVENEMAFNMYAPLDGQVEEIPLTTEQKAAGTRRFEEAVAKRKEKIEWQQMKRIKEQKADPLWQQFEDILTGKDKVDYKREMLAESLESARAYESWYKPEIYTKYLLSPRIDIEPLTSYQRFFKEYFSDIQIQEFREAPEKIWAYIISRVRTKEAKEYPHLITRPVACLKSGWGNLHSQKIAFVAICRSIGIAARLNKNDMAVEYWKHGEFRRLGQGNKQPKARLYMTSKKRDEIWKYEENWSLAKLEGGNFKTLKQISKPWSEEATIYLQAGIYRVITANRLPNGNVYVWQKIFPVTTMGQEVELIMREANLQEMQTRIKVIDFELQNEKRQSAMFPTRSEKNSNILCFLEVGKEPTEHLLNELREKAEDFAKRETDIFFVLKGQDDLLDITLQRTLAVLKNTQICYDDISETAEKLARRMYVNPETLPLIVVFEKQQGIYATSGYNVGTGEMLLKVIESVEG